MIGQGDDHRVDGFVVKNSAQVAVSGDLFVPVFEWLSFAVEVRLVHIAQSGDSCVRDFAQAGNELMPPSAHASDGGG